MKEALINIVTPPLLSKQLYIVFLPNLTYLIIWHKKCLVPFETFEDYTSSLKKKTCKLLFLKPTLFILLQLIIQVMIWKL